MNIYCMYIYGYLVLICLCLKFYKKFSLEMKRTRVFSPYIYTHLYK
jgi:hypothetical protein